MLSWKTPISLILLAGALVAVPAAVAHFQVLIPSQQLLNRPQSIDLTMVFTHPMANGPVMAMGRPTQFGVLLNNRKLDLRKSLTVQKRDGKDCYLAHYQVKAPGDHVFYLEPAPYWEPAEEKMIIHYTKVVVSALNRGDGWDAMVGFPVEIEPLVRPYGLWTGNSFRGVVRRRGKPVPFAEIEVEYYNRDGRQQLPDEVFETQVIKADASGTFSYTMPKAGWWAFAALVDGDLRLPNPDGKAVAVEQGGLLWVQTVDMD